MSSKRSVLAVVASIVVLTGCLTSVRHPLDVIDDAAAVKDRLASLLHETEVVEDLLSCTRSKAPWESGVRES